MAELFAKLELWIYGAGIVFALLLIGAAMLKDVERHTWNECAPDVDGEDLRDERQEA